MAFRTHDYLRISPPLKHIVSVCQPFVRNALESRKYRICEQHSANRQKDTELEGSGVVDFRGYMSELCVYVCTRFFCPRRYYIFCQSETDVYFGPCNVLHCSLNVSGIKVA